MSDYYDDKDRIDWERVAFVAGFVLGLGFLPGFVFGYLMGAL